MDIAWDPGRLGCAPQEATTDALGVIWLAGLGVRAGGTLKTGAVVVMPAGAVVTGSAGAAVTGVGSSGAEASPKLRRSMTAGTLSERPSVMPC